MFGEISIVTTEIKSFISSVPVRIVCLFALVKLLYIEELRLIEIYTYLSIINWLYDYFPILIPIIVISFTIINFKG